MDNLATDSIEALFGRPLEVIEPARQSLPVVLSSPHSGRIYPIEFRDLSRLSALDLRRSEDCYIDEMLAEGPQAGMPLLAARFPRAYLDANREPMELDPRLFREKLPAQANSRSVRVANGLGTIPRIVSEGREIYPHRLPLAEGLRRIEHLYRPYHAQLQRLIDQTALRYGIALVLDVHSMPSTSVTQPLGARNVDVVLGDRYGCSTTPDVVEAATRAFAAVGLHAVVNRPYAGGFITERYGEPNRGRHVLQIEFNRALYLNEITLEPLSGLADLRAALPSVFADIVTESRLSQLGSAAAAE
jgi:N-formylglutamate amidohydrolase